MDGERATSLDRRIERRLVAASDDTGAVAVIVALFMVAALLMAAIVVDVGYLYDARRQLQSAADAAALAGCDELIATDDPGAATAVAEEYAGRNAVGAAVGLVVDDVSIDMNEYSVRVAVSRQTPVFFARLFGPPTRPVHGVAKAMRWKLSGGRYLVPWAVPIIKKVGRVEAWVDGQAPVVLANTGTLRYSGTVHAPSAGSADVFVRVYNEYGVPELIVDSQGSKQADSPVGRLTAAATSPTITEITMDKDFVSSNGTGRSFPVTLRVRTSQSHPWVKVKVGKTDLSMTGSSGGTVWTRVISSTDISFQDDPYSVIPMDVHTGGGPDGVDAYLHIRRNTTPYDLVTLAPMITTPGGAAQIDVYLNDFDPTVAVPGQIYTLRVSPQGNLGGNFGELNFGSIVHAPNDPPDPPGVHPGVNYRDNVAYGYAGGVHVGDIIEMSPGGSGANTDHALSERASTLAPGEDMVVSVPVVEKYQDKTNGAYSVIVVAFASFRITSYGHGDVEGEFLEYTTNPSKFEPNPGGGTSTSGIYAARLVNP